MSNQTKQNFELMKLDPNQIVEMDQWENKLNELVKENPFVEITDSKSYEDAKRSRTALKTGRTDVEKQDTLIGSFLSKFRKNIKEKSGDLVLIVKPHEEKQQNEVSRWEKILQDEKDEKEKTEQIRVDNIKDKIDRVEKELDVIIGHTFIGNIEEAKTDFQNIIDESKNGFDYEEFEFLLDETINLKSDQFGENIKSVIAKHEEEEAQKKKDQEFEFNKLLLKAQKTIDDFNPESEDDNLIEKIDEIFGSDFKFGEWTRKLFEEKTTYIQKALNKLDDLKEKQINGTKQRIIEVREGLLDRVHQMNVDDFEMISNGIKESLDQPIPELLEDEFLKMKTMVEKALERKSEEINDQLIKNQEAEKQKSNELEKLRISRFKKLQSIGMEVDVDGNVSGFDCYWDKYQIGNFHEDDFQAVLVDIQKYKDDSEEEKNRQQLIRQDKITSIDTFVNVKNILFETTDQDFEHQESFVYFAQLRKQMIELCDSNIVQINKF